MARIGIAGAGVLGRLLAWRLSRAGHSVTVFDPAAGPEAPEVGSLAASAAHAERLEAENNRLEEAGLVLSAAVKHVSRALAAFADPIKLLRSKGGEK